MSFLKNYTSTVAVATTIHRIEQVLIACGATGIMKEYGPNAKVLAITFRIRMVKDDPASETMIRLPADERAAATALWIDYAGTDISKDGAGIRWGSQKRKKRADFIEQGERTAWKLIQDWVEVQMTMVQMKQADIMQVFLPYAWDGKRTYYEAVRDGGFKGLLLPEKSEASSSVESNNSKPVDVEVVA